MPALLRTILAVFVGIVVGGLVNYALVRVGAAVVPPPEGVDVGNIESIRANIGAYSAAQLLPPFFAHAIGTLVGAAVATRLHARRPLRPALFVGAWFLIGGITMIVFIPETPAWFAVLDLGVAYLPMAWLGWRLMARRPSA
jgi:hypothetical protein